MKKSIFLLILGTLFISSCTTGSRTISSVNEHPIHSVYEQDEDRSHLTRDY